MKQEPGEVHFESASVCRCGCAVGQTVVRGLFSQHGQTPRRRALARRRASLAAYLRAVEEFASLRQLASGEVGADLHRASALRATPSGRVSDRVLASLRRLRRDGE